jgi:imidazoleglycerol-phosphate dehydratase
MGITGRMAVESRITKETDIKVSINIDGSGVSKVSTGIGFFDHMISGFAKHGLFDIELCVKGDLEVDGHHTVEDAGIVLGRAFLEALGSKDGITRFGDCMLPMDDALVLAAVDISGRHYFEFDLPFETYMIGDFDTQLVKEFFYAFADAARINLHIKKINGTNSHHIAEACFKAVAFALRKAVTVDPRVTGVPSTKGKL